MDEAEVEHLVGLVEDEDLELAKGERALVDEVEQSAGCRHQDIEAARNGANALVVGDAAENDTDRQPHELAIGFGAGGDLRGKLTGRCEHQHADLAGLRDLPRGGQTVERGQHERRGLAGARLGDAEQVAAGQDRRNGLELDGGRLRIIFRGKRIEQGLRQPQALK